MAYCAFHLLQWEKVVSQSIQERRFGLAVALVISILFHNLMSCFVILFGHEDFAN